MQTTHRQRTLTNSLLALALLPLAGVLAAPAWGQCTPRELAKLCASDAVPEDRFGGAIALDGNTALISASGYGPSDVDERVIVFERTGESWAAKMSITRPPAANASDFGFTIALDGDTALVGATHAAFVYVRSAETWVLQAQLIGDDSIADDWFGRQVAIDGDTAIVGAEQEEHDGISSAGAAYVFVRENGTWTQQAKLTASNAVRYDRFGRAVAIDGDVAMVGIDIQLNKDARIGHPGEAYVYERTGNTWTEKAILTAPDARDLDCFGSSIALDGDVALLGAWAGGTEDKPGTGAAYIFRHVDDAWLPEAKLLASDGERADWFGWTVALNGDTALVGSDRADHEGLSSPGAAYIYRHIDGNWVQTNKLVASDAVDGDAFGRGMALRGDAALIGAHRVNYSDLQHAGAVYSFRLHCVQPIGDLNCDAGVDLFDIDPFLQALAGASEDPPFASYLAAYPDCAPSAADINADGNVDALDIDGFVLLLIGA